LPPILRAVHSSSLFSLLPVSEQILVKNLYIN
jgi:hypothetical protein